MLGGFLKESLTPTSPKNPGRTAQESRTSCIKHNPCQSHPRKNSFRHTGAHAQLLARSAGNQRCPGSRCTGIPGGSFSFPLPASAVSPAQEKSYTNLGLKTLKIPSITCLWGSPFNELSMFSSPVPVGDRSVSQAHRDTSLPENMGELLLSQERREQRRDNSNRDVWEARFSFRSSLSHHSEYMRHISRSKAQADPGLEGKQDANW